MRIRYTTFSEAGKRRANQDVCRVVEIPERMKALNDKPGWLTNFNYESFYYL